MTVTGSSLVTDIVIGTMIAKVLEGISVGMSAKSAKLVIVVKRAKCKCILWWSVPSSFFLIKILNKFFGLFFTLTLILLLSFYITKPFIVVVLLFYHKELFYVFYEYVNSLGCLLLYVRKTNLLGFWNCSISGMEKQVP